MKILVVSDTHGETERLISLVRSVKGGIKAIIHAGDYEGDAAEISKQFPDMPVYAVCGNCGYGGIMPPLRMVELGGKRIFITHGHRYNVNCTMMNLTYTALENKADICIFGHTHIPLVEKHTDLVIVNPGSLSRPRGGSGASYAVIDIDDKGGVAVKIVEYKEYK